MQPRSQLDAVTDYKLQSEIFKNLSKAVAELKEGDAQTIPTKEWLKRLKEAKTFDDMVKEASTFDIANPVVKFAAKGLTAGFGLVSAGAHFTHYAMQLRDDIVKYASEHNYRLPNQNQNVNVNSPLLQQNQK